MEDTKQMRENPELSLEEQDRSRRRKKKVRAAMSFGIMALLLLALFFASVNIGSLKVSLSEMLRGMLGEVSENAATVFDLRFPRIFISMLAGAAVAVSGVLFQAVLKNPLADPGIIGISSGAGFTAVVITAFVPSLFFFTPVFAFLGGVLAFFLVYSLSWKGGLSPLRIILVGVAVNAMFSGLSSALNSMTGGNASGVAAIVNGNITMKTWEDVGTLLPYVGCRPAPGPLPRGTVQSPVSGRSDRQKSGRQRERSADPDLSGSGAAGGNLHGGGGSRQFSGADRASHGPSAGWQRSPGADPLLYAAGGVSRICWRTPWGGPSPPLTRFPPPSS